MGRVERSRRRGIAVAGLFALTSVIATVFGWAMGWHDPFNDAANYVAVGTGIMSFGLLLAEFGVHRQYFENPFIMVLSVNVFSQLVRDETTAVLVPLVFLCVSIFSVIKPVPPPSDTLSSLWPFDRALARNEEKARARNAEKH